MHRAGRGQGRRGQGHDLPALARQGRPAGGRDRRRCASELPQPQGRSVRADLTALVDALSREAADPRLARQFALLQGDGQKYPRLLAKYRQTVLEPRRELIRSVLRRGVATGELRENIDVDTVMFLLSGAALARGGPGSRPTRATAGELWTS